MANAPAQTAPCGKCGRPVALTAKRCLYCGAAQFKAAPGTPERAAEEALASEEDKKLQRQAALYRAGMGMRKDAQGPSPDKNLANVLKAILMLFINPFAAIKVIKQIFRP